MHSYKYIHIHLERHLLQNKIGTASAFCTEGYKFEPSASRVLRAKEIHSLFQEEELFVAFHVRVRHPKNTGGTWLGQLTTAIEEKVSLTETVFSISLVNCESVCIERPGQTSV